MKPGFLKGAVGLGLCGLLAAGPAPAEPPAPSAQTPPAPAAAKPAAQAAAAPGAATAPTQGSGTAAQPAGAAVPQQAAGAAVPLEKLEKVTSEQQAADKEAKAAQERIDQLDDETQKMLSEYRRAVADAESHTAYARQLSTQVDSQYAELADLQKQLDEVEATSRAVIPLERKMLDTLKEFVRLDLPFLLKERSGRISTLEQMMDRADVSVSEKYRRIVEAYQVELDYGRTIETYEGPLVPEHPDRTAKFLRIGRVTLLYQTLDGKETGYWDKDRGDWQVDNSYAHAFKQGVAVASKQSAPEMLMVPVPAPVEARS